MADRRRLRRGDGTIGDQDGLGYDRRRRSHDSRLRDQGLTSARHRADNSDGRSDGTRHRSGRRDKHQSRNSEQISNLHTNAPAVNDAQDTVVDGNAALSKALPPSKINKQNRLLVNDSSSRPGQAVS
jgi:hypothetical protein